MYYQRATIRSIYGYMIKLCSAITKNLQRYGFLFLFKGGWSLLIKRLPIEATLRALLSLVNMEKPSKPHD